MNNRKLKTRKPIHFNEEMKKRIKRVSIVALSTMMLTITNKENAQNKGIINTNMILNYPAEKLILIECDNKKQFACPILEEDTYVLYFIIDDSEILAYNLHADKEKWVYSVDNRKIHFQETQVEKDVSHYFEGKARVTEEEILEVEETLNEENSLGR